MSSDQNRLFINLLTQWVMTVKQTSVSLEEKNMHEFNKASLGLVFGGGANIMLNIFSRHGQSRTTCSGLCVNAVQPFRPTRHLLAGISRLPHDAMRKRNICCRRTCLFVRPSRWCIVSRRQLISSNVFVGPVAPSIPVFDPESLPNSKKSFRGAQNTHRWEKIAIFD